MIRRLFSGICFIWLLTAGVCPADTITPVVIDYFYEPGCPECGAVASTVLPELKARYDGFYLLNTFDIGIETNFYHLVAMQDALKLKENASVSMFVDKTDALCGYTAIRRYLFDCLDRKIAERLAPDWQPEITPERQGVNTMVAAERVSAFTLGGVMLFGLLDGVNPCAISTLVFLLSLLAVSGVSRNGMLAMGASYCLATFLTYTAIGFGLLRGLHMLSAFPFLRSLFEAALAAALLLLAFLSFRDAWRYQRRGDPHQVTVQLPPRLKKMIHGWIRRGVGSRRLIVGGFAAGVMVTVLEAVCTGQVYVPALTLVIRRSGMDARAWLLLLLYNTMFLMPLVVAFMAVRFGLGMQTLRRWNLQNVSASKTLMGLFFVAVALYLLRT